MIGDGADFCFRRAGSFFGHVCAPVASNALPGDESEQRLKLGADGDG
jgi:hypothetical protein